MKTSIEEIAARFKKDYARELEIAEGMSKRRFSLEFKQRFVSECNLNQISVIALANKLGMTESVAIKWRRKFSEGSMPALGFKKKSMFQKIEIEEERSETPLAYIEGKAGVRIFGLSMNQMAELLRFEVAYIQNQLLLE